MNMLIAIMAQIFDKVYSNVQLAQMRERLELLRDQKGVLKAFKVNTKSRFLLVVRPKDMLEEQSQEMQLNAIASKIEE